MATEKVKVVLDKLRAHDAQRKLIEGELKALQYICDHENTFVDSGWGRMESTHCEDCGKSW